MANRVNILGVHVSAINMGQALDSIQSWIEDRNDSQYVCVTSAHGVMEAQRDMEFKRILNQSGLTTPDGMSIVWLLRLSEQNHVGRVYGPDLALAVFERGLEFGWKHYFYGGAQEIPGLLAEKMREKFPGLSVTGTHSPPFRELTTEEEEKIVKMVNEADPDIIWIGISTPKQERWMVKFAQRVNAPVLIGIGAAFDFLTGEKKQAPLWMQRNGLEWLFRLLSEPRRLWKRYAELPWFALLVFAQKLGIKSYK
jgi:N-acetylglucosaminyldiphosphoundecaprenol N-acetyl-beta-D-mannosaminyltransferase